WQNGAPSASAASRDQLAAPEHVVAALAAPAKNHVERSTLAAGYHGITDRAEAVSISYILQALTRLGLQLTPGTRLDDATTLPVRLGVVARQRRLLASLLE